MSENKKQLLELLEKYGDSLHRLLFRLTFSEQAAEDLLQELFIKLLGSANTSDVNNLYLYARRTAMNLAFDHLRGLRRTRLDGEPAENAATEKSKPLDELIRREEHRLILEAVSKLKNPYRDIIVLRYIEQQPYELIAEQMGKSSHNIRAVCSKGIKKLRIMLDDNRIFSDERK